MCAATFALLKVAEAKHAIEEWTSMLASSDPIMTEADREFSRSVMTAFGLVDDAEEAILDAIVLKSQVRG
jgi:hypothetical protein